MTRRVVIGALGAIGLVLLLPAVAGAHAVLERTTPGQGATVREQPDRVAFYFDEAVEASFGAVAVFDDRGDEVQEGEAFRPGGDSAAVATRLRSGLADGTYTATFHVVSADSHPVSGGFVFSIGEPSAGGGESVASVLDRQDAGPVTSVAFWADRALGYAAIALVVGGLVFAFAVWRRALAATGGAEEAWLRAGDAFSRRSRLLLGAGIATGLITSLLALPLQVATAAGTSFWEGLDPDLLSEVLQTRFGTVMAVRAAAWALLAVALVAAAYRRPAGQLRPATLGAAGVALAPRPPAPAVALGAVGAAVLVVSPALAGHASTQGSGALLIPAAAVHVAAMSVWLGGLVALIAAVPRATGALPLGDRTSLLYATLIRFSALALGAVIAIAITGAIQAIVEVGSFGALVETGFGRAVLAKIALFAILVGLGAANLRRLLPALARLLERGSSPGRVGLWLRRNLRVEVGLLAVVLGVTAVLVGYAPAADSGGQGPVSGRTTIGVQVLEYTIEPAAVGANQIHLYLFDADDGSQFDGAKEVRLEIIEPDRGIGPLEPDLRHAGPGHYVAPAAEFGAPGEWTVTVTVRTSRFDEDAAELEVPIR